MKYKAYGQTPIKNRTWPNKEIIKSPIWSSVDLRVKVVLSTINRYFLQKD